MSVLGAVFCSQLHNKLARDVSSANFFSAVFGCENKPSPKYAGGPKARCPLKGPVSLCEAYEQVFGYRFIPSSGAGLTGRFLGGFPQHVS
jgi:hypothetical protein